MVQELTPGVFITTLRQIPGEKGDVLHALRNDEATFKKFGEIYFSTVLHGVFKGWKRHTEMVLNLVVPVGTIRFYIVDDRQPLQLQPFTHVVELSRKNY